MITEMCSSPEACNPCSDEGGEGCLQFSARGDDNEVGIDAPALFAEPVPDPLGLVYGIPRLPREPVQVAMKDLNLASAPIQKSMTQSIEEPPEESQDRHEQDHETIEISCTPCLAMAPCFRPAPEKEGKDKDMEEEEDPDAEKPGFFALVCPDAHRRLDEQEFLDETCWCLFCCCAGAGVGRFVHQRLSLRSCCFKCECDDTECIGTEGISSFIWSFSCVHLLCHVPPRHRSPVCVCCNEIYGPVPVHKDEEQTEKDQRDHEEDRSDENPYNFILGEAFTVCYLKVIGCALSAPLFAHHVCGGMCKCCNCKCKYETGAPYNEEDGFCLTMWTCLCCYWYCRLPPELDELNPIAACFGCKLHHVHHLLGLTGEPEGPGEVPGLVEVEEPSGRKFPQVGEGIGSGSG